MPNPLSLYINAAHITVAYKKIRDQLGLDQTIFLAMNQVSQRQGFRFILPESPSEYPGKHQEIENCLTRYLALLDRQRLFFDLLEEVQTQLASSGQETHAQRLRDLVVLETSKDFKIRLGVDGAWLIEWSLSIETDDIQDTREVSVATYEHTWGHIVPWHIVQYLDSGILLYKKKAYATALALMSIAVEATLRDVLSTRGYSFTHGASTVNIYDYSRAQADATETGYTLTFLDAMPKSPADLPVSAGGSLPVDVEIRRVIKPRRNRTDLEIKAPACLIDHWSGNRVSQPGQPKNLGGLGEILGIARDRERVITPLDLPIDVDDILKVVRNNLIHLSNDSMDEELPRYAHMSNNGRFTVRDFVNKPNLVFDLIADIPRFVNEQYVRLWRTGLHI